MVDASRRRSGRPRLSGRKRLAFRVAMSAIAFTVALLLCEVSFRLFWAPRYWIHSDRWLIGSGQTEVGKKWWPDTTYSVDGSEFRLAFRTNASGYRFRPGPVPAGRPYRIAFVGDSKVCVNYGISATDLFDYWHRIVHDVLPAGPPEALVLCIYPGNDFQGLLPEDGFSADGQPLGDYFQKPGWTRHLIAWINLHSKFGFFAQRALLCWGPNPSKSDHGPKNWWAHPELAAATEGSPALRRTRSLFQSIDEACRRHGTKLCILVVGPVANYRATAGSSPLARILANWHIDVPVIDVAIEARERRDWASLVFPFDGHLNESGHAYVAREAASPLRAALDGTGPTVRR
jgi:hypothetical protein